MKRTPVSRTTEGRRGAEENTSFTYFYRDEENFYTPHTVVFAGRITGPELELFGKCLAKRHGFFTPRETGLMPLSDFDALHEPHLSGIENSGFDYSWKPPTEEVDIHGFVKRFAAQPLKEKRRKSGKPSKTGWSSLDRTDWSLLYEQKLALVHLLMKEGVEISGSPEVAARVDTHLQGILNLLDSVMDEAAEKGLFSFPAEEVGPGR